MGVYINAYFERIKMRNRWVVNDKLSKLITVFIPRSFVDGYRRENLISCYRCTHSTTSKIKTSYFRAECVWAASIVLKSEKRRTYVRVLQKRMESIL